MRWLVLVAVVAVAALAACTSEQRVLALDVVTSCEAAFEAPARSACAFPGTCTRAGAPADPACCSELAYCSDGELVRDLACNPDCAACLDDRDCTPGAAICTGEQCTPCPPPVNCPPCPTGWVALARNGCPTCDCAPPSECSPDPSNGPGCGPVEVCYPGARCTLGCAPGDDCCANACSAPGCQDAAPLGCLMACPPNLPCNQCAADACECVNGGWTCTPRCIDNEPITSSCLVP